MISLTCNHCQTVLTIDDAFAGGVCRCQHCGTIQTVPSRLKATARASSPDADESPAAPTQPTPTPSGGKTLYRKRTRADGPVSGGTGLEELAEVVASSGLSGSGLASERLRKPAKLNPPIADGAGNAIAPPPKNLLPIVAAVGLAVLALLILIGWLFLNNRDSGPRAPAAKLPANATSPDAPADLSLNAAATNVGPSFAGLALADANTVIYVLDRGNGTADNFDTLKEVTCKSIESLGGDRKFQVIFWNNGSDDAYPTGLPIFARSENLAACRKAIEDITAFGQSDPIPALAKALANHPGVIIFATGKSLELDSTLATQILEMHSSTSPKTKIDTFAISESDSPVLKELSGKTGGKYQKLTGNTLRGLRSSRELEKFKPTRVKTNAIQRRRAIAALRWRRVRRPRRNFSKRPSLTKQFANGFCPRQFISDLATKV